MRWKSNQNITPTFPQYLENITFKPAVFQTICYATCYCQLRPLLGRGSQYINSVLFSPRYIFKYIIIGGKYFSREMLSSGLSLVIKNIYGTKAFQFYKVEASSKIHENLRNFLQKIMIISLPMDLWTPIIVHFLNILLEKPLKIEIKLFSTKKFFFQIFMDF